MVTFESFLSNNRTLYNVFNPVNVGPRVAARRDSCVYREFQSRSLHFQPSFLDRMRKSSERIERQRHRARNVSRQRRKFANLMRLTLWTLLKLFSVKRTPERGPTSGYVQGWKMKTLEKWIRTKWSLKCMFKGSTEVASFRRNDSTFSIPCWF